MFLDSLFGLFSNDLAIDLGTANTLVYVKGRDLVAGIPEILAIDLEEVREAISEQVAAIVQTVRIALEQMPPQLAADVVDRGIVVTGGGALLKTSMPCCGMRPNYRSRLLMTPSPPWW